MTRYGIRHVRTGLYSPQANAAERGNRSVLQILRATTATDQRDWDTQLSRIECALSNGLHESIGMEPYYAMFRTRMVTHGIATDKSPRQDGTHPTKSDPRIKPNS